MAVSLRHRINYFHCIFEAEKNTLVVSLTQRKILWLYHRNREKYGDYIIEAKKKYLLHHRDTEKLLWLCHRGSVKPTFGCIREALRKWARIKVKMCTEWRGWIINNNISIISLWMCLYTYVYSRTWHTARYVEDIHAYRFSSSRDIYSNTFIIVFTCSHSQKKCHTGNQRCI